MGCSASIKQGDLLPIGLTLADGAVNQYPRAYVYDDDDNLLNTVDLVHKANGFYAPAIANDVNMPNEVFVSVLYVVFSNAGRTVENTIYERDIDVFVKLKIYDTELANISSAVSNVPSLVWSYSTRLLTGFGTLVADIWSYATRTLTGFGTLTADIWSYGTRTLTGFGTLVTTIWAYAARTLTGIGASGIATAHEYDDRIARILGLSQENVFIDNPVYDSDDNLVSARLRIYSVASSVGTDNDVLATYTITAIGAGVNMFTTWKQVKL